MWTGKYSPPTFIHVQVGSGRGCRRTSMSTSFRCTASAPSPTSTSSSSSKVRCRANMAHIRQSIPNVGLGLKTFRLVGSTNFESGLFLIFFEVLKTFEVFPFLRKHQRHPHPLRLLEDLRAFPVCWKYQNEIDKAKSTIMIMPS